MFTLLRRAETRALEHSRLLSYVNLAAGRQHSVELYISLTLIQPWESRNADILESLKPGIVASSLEVIFWKPIVQAAKDRVVIGSRMMFLEPALEAVKSFLYSLGENQWFHLGD